MGIKVLKCMKLATKPSLGCCHASILKGRKHLASEDRQALLPFLEQLVIKMGFAALFSLILDSGSSTSLLAAMIVSRACFIVDVNSSIRK
jgi:hypothetical protein